MGGGRPNFLFENLVGSGATWPALRLEGDGETVNRDAIGAEVSFRIDDRRISRHLRSSRGTYCSQDTRVLHFGFGHYRGDLTAVLRRPDGTEQRLSFGADELNRFYHIEYGAEPVGWEQPDATL